MESASDHQKSMLVCASLYAAISLFGFAFTPLLLREGLWMFAAAAGPTWHLYLVWTTLGELLTYGQAGLTELISTIFFALSWSLGFFLAWKSGRLRKKTLWILALLWILSAGCNIMLFGLMSLM